MSDEITFLSVEDVIYLHRNTIEHEGGLEGLRDVKLLESAVTMPRQQFGGEYLHPDIPAMAAAYLFHIAQNHPFADGNKRAAALTTLVFLKGNRVNKLPDPASLEEVVMKVASGDFSKEELIRWMRKIIAR